MRKYIPSFLLYSSIPAGLIIVLSAWLQPAGYEVMITGLLLYGVVSDFLDGFTARMWHLSTEHLRKADSNVDQFFWLAAAIGVYLVAPDFLAFIYGILQYCWRWKYWPML